jgi:hypothetical protein
MGSVIIRQVSGASIPDALGVFEELVVAAQAASRARFSMQSTISDDDDAPDCSSGIVDLRSGEYVSQTACFVGGVYYGRENEAATWTSFPWEAGHLPISPLWLLLVLRGADAGQAVAPATNRDILVSAVCDLDTARRASGVELAALGGDPARHVSITVAADAGTQSVRRIDAQFKDWSFVCEYSDFGTDAEIVAPTPSTPVDADVSPARRWFTRRFPTPSIMTTPARLKRSSKRSTSEKAR